MKHKTTMTLSEARDYYDMPRQAIANRLRSDGVRPVSAVRNNSHRPASLYRVAGVSRRVGVEVRIAPLHGLGGVASSTIRRRVYAASETAF